MIPAGRSDHWRKRAVMKKKKSIESVKCCLAAAGLCMCFLYLIFGFSRVLPGGRSVFIRGDGLEQTVPIIKTMFRNLFSGEGIAYSFNSGMGMPTTALYAYYGLSPLNLVFLLIDDINIAYYVFYSAKLMLAAAAFALLLHKIRSLKVLPCAVFGCAYAMNAFAIAFTPAVTFFDMMYMLPLITLALWNFVKTGRWRCLCILYALSFVIQFYSAYMIGIFSFLIYLCFAADSYGTTWKLWKKSAVKYVLCVLLAVLLATPVLLPTAVELFSQMAEDRTTLNTLDLMPWDFVKSFYPGFSEYVYNKTPMIYSGLLPLLMCIWWFAEKGIQRRKKIIFSIPLVYLILCCFVTPLYLFMHAFDAPDGYCFRFSWLIGFWVIFLASGLAKKHEESFEPQKGFMILTAVIMIAVCYVSNYVSLLNEEDAVDKLNVSSGLFTTIFVIAYTLLILIGKKKGFMRSACFAVFALEILCSGFMNEYIDLDTIVTNTGIYRIWQEQADTSLDQIHHYEDQDPSLFYRIHYDNEPINNLAMLKGYHGLGWFLAIENKELRDFLRATGYATSMRIVSDYGSSKLMQMLLAQKYSVTEYTSGEHEGEYFVDRNSYALAPAYMTSEDLLDWKADDSNPFVTQNTLAEAMCGQGEVWKLREGRYAVETKNMDWIPFDGGVLIRKNPEDSKDSKAVITLEDHGEDILYLYIPRKQSRSDPKSPLLISSADIGGMDNKPYLMAPHILPLARNEKNEWQATVIMADSYEQVDFSTLYLASFDREALEGIYEKLKPGELKLSSVSESEWIGTINVNADMPILYTTIPYDKGWELLVDGRETEIIPLMGNAFIGAKLDEGEHEIQLSFHNPWLLRGLLAGLAGLVIFGGSVLWDKRRSSMKPGSEEQRNVDSD